MQNRLKDRFQFHALACNAYLNAKPKPDVNWVFKRKIKINQPKDVSEMFHKFEDYAKDETQMTIIPVYIEYNKLIEQEMKKMAGAYILSLNSDPTKILASPFQVKMFLVYSLNSCSLFLIGT